MSVETHDGEAYKLNTWDYQEILADLKTRYDDPVDAFDVDDAHELVEMAKALEPTEADHDDRDEFVEMLDGMRDDYKGAGTIMYNPENTEEYVHTEDAWQVDEKYQR